MKSLIGITMIVAFCVAGCDKPAEGCDRVAVASAFGCPSVVQSFAVAQPVVQSFAVAQPVVQTYAAPVVSSFAVAQPVAFASVGNFAVSNCALGGCNLGVRSRAVSVSRGRIFGGSRSRAVSTSGGLFGFGGFGGSRSVSISRVR